MRPAPCHTIRQSSQAPRHFGWGALVVAVGLGCVIGLGAGTKAAWAEESFAQPQQVQQSNASSGPPLSAEEFDAHVTGRTLTYSQYGAIYGIEEYLPGRKVRWQFAEDVCQYGSWYPKGDLICFTYEYDSGEHCWKFWREGDGLKALSTNDMPGEELSEVSQTAKGLNCAGPDVGV